MNIYVHSAGFVEDYSLQQPESAPALPAEVLQWQEELDKGDLALALAAGLTNEGWYIMYRNLLLPNMYDFRNRRIMLNICLGPLPDEQQIRALAIAYLNFELKFSGNRCQGRFCPQLAEAYKATEGDYEFDFHAARCWAEEVLSQQPFGASELPLIPIIRCTTNPAEDSYLDRIRDRLLSHRLRDLPGIRLLWAEHYVPSSSQADIVLQFTAGEGSFEQQTSSGRATVHDEPPRKQTKGSPRKIALLLVLLLLLITGIAIYLHFGA